MRTSVFLWTLALVFLGVCNDFLLAHLSVFMDSCACVSQCLYGLLCLCFSVFVWTLALVFLSVCMDSCACVSQCLYGLL